MKTIKTLLFGLLIIFSLTTTAQEKPFKVDVRGEGKPILLFPGFTCTGEVWDTTIAELSKNYECHVFTFAGFGDVPAIEKPWLPKIKEGVVNYISEKKLENPVLLGHSLGGALALWMATESDSFKELIIVDALPSTGALMMPDFKSEYMVYDSPYNKQTLAMNAVDFDAMVGQMASGMAKDKPYQERIKNWMIQADRETYVYGYTDLLKLDLREDLAKIKIPVTILAATEPYGLEMAKSTYEAQYKALSKYTIEFASGSSHFIMYDQPQWFMENLKNALND
ncbi:alpha/beta fold hydrolase [Maribacter hydrothermalis]|uniref:Alpha/beta hydrolase n=1 Tax=Maribacter hydrothermalis TaxID=1836467 RepID=A0A1B7ZE93_9FLAO|nr:alpha/beta hydrolase [Maribacter hydrothermalis]APQ17398.1 alpha/beta hydrolase [Maribacter hydrothermalis]OBR41876.1 alpha/beta hydrolase [Maribacter hydrothermalis]